MSHLVALGQTVLALVGVENLPPFLQRDAQNQYISVIPNSSSKCARSYREHKPIRKIKTDSRITSCERDMIYGQ